MHGRAVITSVGDEVILPTPFYFNHEMAIEMAGCRVVRVPTDDHYQLRPRRHSRRDHERTPGDCHHFSEQSQAARF
jgi:aspartate/methionine/tyrosine aminotransferase